MSDLGRLGRGLFWNEIPVGTKWHSAGRTITETDLVSYVNLGWYTEDLFTDLNDRSDNAIKGRPVPAVMVLMMAEGLVLPSIVRTGLAFLQSDLEIKGPTMVGDTIYVHCEVIEARQTSNASRGLVRTRNSVLNQREETVLIYQPLRIMRGREAP
jgi:hypothetical protein